MSAHDCTARVVPEPGHEMRRGKPMYHMPVMRYRCAVCSRYVSPAKLFRKPDDVLMRIVT